MKKSGVVETRARNNQAIKLEGDEEWYSTFRFKLLDEMVPGATVSFDYTTNTKGGKEYFNITKGSMEVTAAAPQRATAGGGSANAREVGQTRGGALKVAGDVVMRYYGDSPPAELEEIGRDIIALSRQFEAYVFGTDTEED